MSSFNMPYLTYFARFYKNNSGYLTKSDRKYLKPLNTDSQSNYFHTRCPYSKNQRCFCSLNQPTKENQSHEDFLKDLYNGNLNLDFSGNNVKVSKKKTNKIKKKKQKMVKEQFEAINFSKMGEFEKKINDKVLNFYDFKEIQKNINDDKKICEKCGVNLGDNFYKGWKHDNGDYGLLCYSCFKKYFTGANEIRYDYKREENNPMYYGLSTGLTNKGNSFGGVSIPPFKSESGFGAKIATFQVNYPNK